MGNKFMRKMVATFVALALVFTSGIGVFAASSSEVGKVSSINTVEKVSSKSVAISWPAVSNASAYVVYKNGKQVAKVNGTSFTLTGLKAGETYTLSVAAVAKDGKTIGTATSVTGKTASSRWMKSMKFKKIKKGKKKATITWKKVKGATAYQIAYSKDGKTWKYKWVKGGKKTKAVIKKLSKGTWKFKVRAVKGSYLGEFSKVKKVKIK